MREEGHHTASCFLVPDGGPADQIPYIFLVVFRVGCGRLPRFVVMRDIQIKTTIRHELALHTLHLISYRQAHAQFFGDRHQRLVKVLLENLNGDTRWLSFLLLDHGGRCGCLWCLFSAHVCFVKLNAARCRSGGTPRAFCPDDNSSTRRGTLSMSSTGASPPSTSVSCASEVHQQKRMFQWKICL